MRWRLCVPILGEHIRMYEVYIRITRYTPMPNQTSALINQAHFKSHYYQLPLGARYAQKTKFYCFSFTHTYCFFLSFCMDYNSACLCAALFLCFVFVCHHYYCYYFQVMEKSFLSRSSTTKYTHTEEIMHGLGWVASYVGYKQQRKKTHRKHYKKCRRQFARIKTNDKRKFQRKI